MNGNGLKINQVNWSVKSEGRSEVHALSSTQMSKIEGTRDGPASGVDACFYVYMRQYRGHHLLISW